MPKLPTARFCGPAAVLKKEDMSHQTDYLLLLTFHIVGYRGGYCY